MNDDKQIKPPNGAGYYRVRVEFRTASAPQSFEQMFYSETEPNIDALFATVDYVKIHASPPQGDE